MVTLAHADILTEAAGPPEGGWTVNNPCCNPPQRQVERSLYAKSSRDIANLYIRHAH